jgi:hypothetical protein
MSKAHLHPNPSSVSAPRHGQKKLQLSFRSEEISLKQGSHGCSVSAFSQFSDYSNAKAQYVRPIFPDIWYVVPQIWDIPKKVKDKYDKVGFRFEEDIEFYKKLTRS